MNEVDPNLVDEIFSAALDLDKEERADFVAARCRGNAALESRVSKLLDAAEAEESELDTRLREIRERVLGSLFADDGDDRSGAENLSGQRVGAWRLVERLARGGLATVYLAHRADGEYEQRAAFKVLRRGLDTDDLVARFRAERQILSALEHPGIAKIHDGGALPDGRPYLVLEFVDGKAITDHTRVAKLTLRERVSLVQQVLRALHHAHRHLIVHRDIKPSNILVSADGHVSLLDFGIAKLLDPDALPGASTMTRTGVSMLTPGYSSPEQQAGSAVTTASDIYQAGTVLYELLTGERPRIQSANGERASLQAPSSLIKGTADFNAVRGDLDAIVLKAMHIDPVRRYSSAEEMEFDLQRYLDGRPVLAQPDSFRYRLNRLHKRKPWAIPSMAIAILATLGFVSVLLAYNEQLRIEQRRAAAAQEFMVDILASPDPFRPADPDLGSDITVVEALDHGVENLDARIADDPQLKASVLASIAGVYASLDRHAQAIALREQALAIEREVFGSPSEPVLASLQMLASACLARSDFDAAMRYSEEQLADARELYSADDPALGAAEAVAGDVAGAIGDFARSRELWERAIDRMRPADDEFAIPLITSLSALANQLMSDEPGLAKSLNAEARQRTEALFGADSLPAAQTRSQAASIYSANNEYDKAEQEFLAVIPVYEAHLGSNHSETLQTINNLGILYNRMEMPDRAEAVFAEVLERYNRKFDERHRLVADGYQNLATAITRAGRYSESIPMHQKAFEIYRDILPQDQPVVAYPLLSKAYAEVNDGQYEAAEASGRQALDIVLQFSDDSFLVGVANCLVGRALEGQQDSRASAHMARAHELLVASVVSDTYRRFCGVPVAASD